MIAYFCYIHPSHAVFFFFFILFCYLYFLQEMILSDLQAETTYSVTVAAYTTKGDGARSKPKVVTTMGAGRRLNKRP